MDMSYFGEVKDYDDAWVAILVVVILIGLVVTIYVTICRRKREMTIKFPHDSPPISITVPPPVLHEVGHASRVGLAPPGLNSSQGAGGQYVY